MKSRKLQPRMLKSMHISCFFSERGGRGVEPPGAADVLCCAVEWAGARGCACPEAVSRAGLGNLFCLAGCASHRYPYRCPCTDILPRRGVGGRDDFRGCRRAHAGIGNAVVVHRR